MNIEEIREYCLAKRGATDDCAFGPDVILFRLCEKIFASIDLNRPNLVVLKTTEEEAIELREHFRGIQGAWHWNKRYWSEVYLDADVEDSEVLRLIDVSYNIIRTSLPKKTLYNFPDLPKGWIHEHFPILDSTMNYMRTAEANKINANFFLVSADYQTAGRGQGKNTWESEDGQNLLLAFRFHPSHVKAVDQFLILQCISVAVVQALQTYCKQKVKIKWPNDIYCDDKKVCGILIEHDLYGDHLLETRCGIGININQEIFNSPAPNPVSLKQLSGKNIDRAAVLRNFLKYFMKIYLPTKENTEDIKNKIFDAYCRRLYRLDGWYPYRDKDGEFEAHIYNIQDDGCLVLTDRNKKKRKYAHKEVEYILTKKEYEPSSEETLEWWSFGYE